MCGLGGIPALEVNDNFLNSAIVTSELLPPIPTTRHTYHLQQGGKEHSSSSKEIPHISSVEENLRDERLLKLISSRKLANKRERQKMYKQVRLSTWSIYKQSDQIIKNLKTQS